MHCSACMHCLVRFSSESALAIVQCGWPAASASLRRTNNAAYLSDYYSDYFAVEEREDFFV